MTCARSRGLRRPANAILVPAIVRAGQEPVERLVGPAAAGTGQRRGISETGLGRIGPADDAVEVRADAVRPSGIEAMAGGAGLRGARAAGGVGAGEQGAEIQRLGGACRRRAFPDRDRGGLDVADIAEQHVALPGLCLPAWPGALGAREIDRRHPLDGIAAPLRIGRIDHQAREPIAARKREYRQCDRRCDLRLLPEVHRQPPPPKNKIRVQKV